MKNLEPVFVRERLARICRLPTHPPTLVSLSGLSSLCTTMTYWDLFASSDLLPALCRYFHTGPMSPCSTSESYYYHVLQSRDRQTTFLTGSRSIQKRELTFVLHQHIRMRMIYATSLSLNCRPGSATLRTG